MKIHVTVEERLLLHLLKFKRFEDKYNVPLELSQEGIAQAIAIRRNDVSRTIKSIMEKGWVDVTLGHVKGILRRRKIYFLTPEGFTNAQRIHGSLMDIMTPVKGVDAPQEMKLKELNAFFDTSYSIIQLIQIINSLGHFEIVEEERINELEEKIDAPLGHDRAGLNHLFENPPPDARLIGRNAEMKTAKQVTGRFGILVIKGLAGIGKSSFGYHLVKMHEKTHELFWFRVRQFDSLKKVLNALAELLEMSGHDALAKYLSREQEVDLNIVGDLLGGSFEKEKKYILTFDDVQKSTSALIQFFNLLVELKDTMPSVSMIFIGRHLPKFYDKRQVVVEKRIVEMELTGLDRISSMEIVNDREMTEEEFDRIYTITHGHPLALELVDISTENDSFDDINEFLNQEVFSGLNDSERRILECICIFREPVPVGEVLIDEGIDYGSIDRLVYRSIIHEVRYGSYEMHDLLKNAVEKRMGPAVKRQLHERAARYYTHVDGIHVRLEEIYHLLEAGDMEQALDRVLTHSKLLQENKFSLELVSAITRIQNELDADRLNQVKDTLDDLCVRVRDLWGRWDYVFEHIFQNILFHMIGEKRPICIPFMDGPFMDTLPAMGRICSGAADMDLDNWTFPPITREDRLEFLVGYQDVARTAGEWKEAIRQQESSIKTLKSIEDHIGTLNMLLELGWLHWRLGHIEQANSCYREALQLAEDRGISRMTEKIWMNLGLVSWSLGNMDEAMTHFDEAVKHHIDREAFIQLLNLKAAVKLEGDSTEEARALFTDAVEASNDIGLYTMYAYSHLHLIEIELLKVIREHPYAGPDSDSDRALLEAVVNTIPRLRSCREMFQSIFEKNGKMWTDIIISGLEKLLLTGKKVPRIPGGSQTR